MTSFQVEKGGKYFNIFIQPIKDSPKGAIFYWDNKHGLWQYLPADPQLEKKILMGRNKYPPHIRELLKIDAQDQKEYDEAQNDIDLRNWIINDLNKKNCNIISENKVANTI